MSGSERVTASLLVNAAPTPLPGVDRITCWEAQSDH